METPSITSSQFFPAISAAQLTPTPNNPANSVAHDLFRPLINVAPAFYQLSENITLLKRNRVKILVT